ncbi:uncharacterized protein LOC126881871 [Diabrotica virgifera virgifera]|uniref:HTH CENPB-type domain-containing protein n=4 Tax=Diabrotica virgifera virgifera TaxID=50390 RepID=A0ABM5JX12_DIAVI|nr:uncharacterized protein LOC126881871 [Diabrotica virgifera virgifera]
MSLAIDAVKNEGMSKKCAAKEFCVPRTTLKRRLENNCLKRKMGPKSILSEGEEKLLANWILSMGRKGFPVNATNLISTVHKIMKETGRSTVFKDGMPGKTWFAAFLRRHPEIKKRRAESITKSRAAVSKADIEKWFNEIENYLKEEGMIDILKYPNRIYNADETGFSLDPKSGIVLGPAKLEEDFYERKSNAEKEQITVMACFSADGITVPPMVIYPYKKIPKDIVNSAPPEWAVGRSDSGWMNSEVFYEYIGNHFLPYLKEKNIPQPVLFFVDGHRSHLTKQVSELCEASGIILVALFPNATHILQPADVSIFKPLKTGWQTIVRTWKFENFPKDVTKYTFATILSTVFKKYATESTIRNGFRKCGLFPFEKSNVDYTKCVSTRQVVDPTNLSDIKNTIITKGNILSELEKKIPPLELNHFRTNFDNKDDWKGDLQFKKLYEVWAEFKNEALLVTNKHKHVTGEDDSNLMEGNEEMSISFSVPTASTSTPNGKQREESVILPNEEQSQNGNSTILQDKSTTSLNVSESFLSPDKLENVALYKDKEDQGYVVSTPFKKCLIFPKTPEKEPPKRKRKIFPAVVSTTLYRAHYDNITSKSGPSKQSQIKIKKPAVKRKVISESESSADDVPYCDEDLDASDVENYTIKNIHDGDFVIIKYNGNLYPGKVIKANQEGAEVSSMEKAGYDWKWPEKEDVLFYFYEDIKKIIREPLVKGKRGYYSVPELSSFL